MPKSTVSIFLDHLPPTAERLCALPIEAAGKDFEGLELKLIDNFPWDFECRMKSCTSYDEIAIGFVSEQCKALGLNLYLRFPCEDDFARILRLRGYRKFIKRDSGKIIIDSEAVGFKHLIESVAEDAAALLPSLKFFTFPPVTAESGYTEIVSDILINAGYKTAAGCCEADWLSADEFLCGADSIVVAEYRSLKDSYQDYCIACEELRLSIIMSQLSSMPPAAGRKTPGRLVNDLHINRKAFDNNSATFRKIAAGRIEPDWLDLMLRAMKLAADELLHSLEDRARQSGLLN
ncbi:MAG: hypothetical protein PQJ61_01840 [Spirochaetales bacterium]|uniref:Uncharacterized protein n=1 Tax=Candidatus Thalassospirochaeta sargassi TaxID=3119039 RepID=A0AAJ1IA55_9SPIO|nr:hypothetical protein [Spirochaetales bacterium]